MRVRTAVAAVVVLVGLAGAAAFGLAGTGGVGSDGIDDGTLAERWVSDPQAALESNHHTPAVAFVDGESFVAVPINSRQGKTCVLSVLDGNGSERWRRTVASEACTVHSVSDPTIADFDGDGDREVIAATSTKEIVVYGLRSGREEFRHDLTSYGYAKPLVADLLPAEGNETVVTDLLGGVFAFRGDGSVAWQRTFDDARVRQPAVADFDADGQPEIAIGQLDGEAIVLERDGRVAWRTSLPNATSVKWMATGQADGDDPIELVFATFFGEVMALDGTNGSVEWRRNLSARGATVHTLGDGDGDGRPEVYVGARDGTLRSLDAANGSVEWTTQLTGETVLAMPPPSLGDLDGDGNLELVAVTGNGLVSVVDPTTGETVDAYEREVPIWTFPRLADADGDGRDEVFVIYGDGRVVALSYRS
ncbi:FG-GAP-like repeat-containing protein [Halococcus agarilyticus]|uniref:FG-GAP-like repeat-containing protein n=1 Tax=Halococcus agarilyticus TaxID=1232219 RepID=UPI000677D2E1|nr:FG-GAP-like repeat-containing protein [Halococcus agarilyticus]